MISAGTQEHRNTGTQEHLQCAVDIHHGFCEIRNSQCRLPRLIPRLGKDSLRCRWCCLKTLGQPVAWQILVRMLKAMGSRNTSWDICDIPSLHFFGTLFAFVLMTSFAFCLHRHLSPILGCCMILTGYFNDCNAKFTVCSDSKLEAYGSLGFLPTRLEFRQMVRGIAGRLTFWLLLYLHGCETLNRENKNLFAFSDSFPLAACQLSPLTIFVSACATWLRKRFQISFSRTRNSMEPLKFKRSLSMSRRDIEQTAIKAKWRNMFQRLHLFLTAANT